MSKRKKTNKSIIKKPLANSTKPTLYSKYLKPHFYPALLLLISLVVNISILCDYLNSPFAQAPIWDSNMYWKWAIEIASGKWLGSSIFYQTPLYPYFLALFVKVFGQHYLPVFLFQMLISSASTLLVYRITTQITNKQTGFIAGLLYALYGMQVFYSLKLLSECLSVFLMLLTIFFLLHRTKSKYLVWAGVCFGFLLIAKPHMLLALPFLCVWFYLDQRCMPVFLKRATLFFVPALVLVAMVAWRNYAVGKDFVLVSSNGGENFFIGNNIKADGTYSPIEGISQDIEYQNEDINAVAQERTGQKLKRSEASKYWFNQGLNFIVHNPVAYFKLELTKTKLMFSGAERTTMYSLKFERENLTKSLWISFVNFYLILPFFIVGLIYSFGEWKKNLLLYCFIIANVLNVLMFFYDTRFFLLAMVFWIIYAARGIGLLWEKLKAQQSLDVLKSPATIIFLFCSFTSVLIFSADKKVAKPDGILFYAMGDIYWGQKNFTAALNSFVKSSDLNPNNWMPALGICKVLFEQGKKEIAAKLYLDTFPNLSADFKTLALRDKDLDPLREYIKTTSMF